MNVSETLSNIFSADINEIEVETIRPSTEGDSAKDIEIPLSNEVVPKPKIVPVRKPLPENPLIQLTRDKLKSQIATNKETAKNTRTKLRVAKQHALRKLKGYQALKNYHTTMKMKTKLESQGYKVFETDPNKRILKVIKTDFENDEPPDLKLDL